MSMRDPTNAAGFTLVEVLVVMSITVLITGFLIVNFSRSRVDLNQATITVADAIREAQALTLSGSLIQGTYRCGYGIHFMVDGYFIYAGPDANVADCSLDSPDYTNSDTIVRTALLPNNVLEIVQPAPDIFFEPPDPKTYINGSNAPGISTNIILRRKGANCPGSDCRTIHVTSSGRIQTQ